MTVIFSKKCEIGLQAVLYLAIAPEDVSGISAQEISDKIKAPKEFVSKILQSLVKWSIVASKKGKNGGFALAKPAKEVKLINIVEAIDGLEVFSTCVLGFPGCSHSEPCPVHNKWGKIREEAFKMLSESSLEDLKEEMLNKINDLN